MLNETDEGIELEALGIGSTQIELHQRGELLRSYGVTVTVPDELRLVIERQDLFDTTLSQLETPVDDEIAVLAGEEVHVHVRYFDAGTRIYGANAVETVTDLTTLIPEWAPQENVVGLSSNTPGTYPVTFRVGSIEQTIDVHVASEAVSLELYEPAELQLLVDPTGAALFDQLIKAEARDAEGRILQGTLPIRWTMDVLGSEELGEGTMLGITTDDEVTIEAEVTAFLGELSATHIARGLATYVAP